jgi:geranylgeranyl diphosphate synthase type II
VRLGKHTYVSEFGLEGARALARESHAGATGALERATGGAEHGELRQIADFILTRTA